MVDEKMKDLKEKRDKIAKLIEELDASAVVILRDKNGMSLINNKLNPYEVVATLELFKSTTISDILKREEKK